MRPSFRRVLAIREHPRRAIPFSKAAGPPRESPRQRALTSPLTSGPMVEFTWVQTLLLSRLVRRNDRLAICASSHTTAGLLRQSFHPFSPFLPHPSLIRDPFRSHLPSSCHLSRYASSYAVLPDGHETRRSRQRF